MLHVALNSLHLYNSVKSLLLCASVTTARSATADTTTVQCFSDAKDSSNRYSRSSSGSYADTDIDSVCSDHNENNSSSGSGSSSSSDSVYDDCAGNDSSVMYGMYTASSTDKLTNKLITTTKVGTSSSNRPILPPSLLIEILTFTDR
jgi:hypothetical protein